ncbi:hypothetical protein NXH64_00875 [Butyrivibrio fibrisolvens]|uniref:hypothetical protein n=1 Tax=Pseudobutyrivibrio ruminis TaxID=46206 RepID=UPI000485EC12|nr:hypothetical protein [Pseudobutyrivibrio ruminis]MDC7278044.1 hypothetical protein [Butyrivibrio fibrisolvens]
MGKDFEITVTHVVKASLGPEDNERVNNILKELKSVIAKSIAKFDDTDYFENGYDAFFQLSNSDYTELVESVYKCLESALSLVGRRRVQEAFFRNYYDLCDKALNGEEYADEIITISWGKDEIEEINVDIHSVRGIIEASLWLAGVDIIRSLCTPGNIPKIR